MTLPTIFISHSMQDHDWCSVFADALSKHGFDVWYDARELRGGNNWISDIEQELKARDVFLIILSQNSWNSYWCQQELRLAQVGRRRIVPVMFQQTQVTGFLETVQFINMIGQPALYAATFVDNLLRGRTSAAPAQPMPESLHRRNFQEAIQDNLRYIIPPTVIIPAGPFLMGSDPTRDYGTQDDEKPRHTVRLNAYDVAIFPVTVAEYELALRLGVVVEPPAIGTVSWQYQQQTRDNPVVCVTWPNAMAYARWLSQCSGQNWRLLTEAEWEKAARGDDGRFYPWGNVWNPAQANTVESGMGHPTPIGTYPTTGSYGLYDMSGNVWEWTTTIPASYPYAADGRERSDGSAGRVVRGGSWDNGSLLARCAFRMMYEANTYATDLGFRLCNIHS